VIGQADLVTLLSEHETQGIAVLEALSLKRPVLVAHACALREFVDSNLARAEWMQAQVGTGQRVSADLTNQMIMGTYGKAWVVTGGLDNIGVAPLFTESRTRKPCPLHGRDECSIPSLQGGEVNAEQAAHLSHHLEAGRALYNALLGEAMKRLSHMRTDPAWQQARVLSRLKSPPAGQSLSSAS
jgi:hypothetical protein